MFNQKKEQKKMKKFWNLMLAALVIIGAAACTENNENVENIAAHDIANGDVSAALQGGSNADGGLRGAGTHSNDGQTDDNRWNFQQFSNRRAAFYEVVRTFDQQYGADQK